MKPKGEFLRSLRKQEKDAKAKYEIEVPLLFLLFRVYGCWSEQFYDKLEKAGTSVTSFLPGKSEAEKRRDKDAVNTLPSLIYAKVPGHSLAHSLTHSLTERRWSWRRRTWLSIHMCSCSATSTAEPSCA